MKLFTPADILLPISHPECFAVIACDQHTSEPEYWEKAAEAANGHPSALSMILPEAFLGRPDCPTAESIQHSMEAALAGGVFRTYPNAMIYVERRLTNGRIRRGIVGALTLAGYDYRAGSHAPVRATEATVVERIPPRLALRQNAALELPHVLMLCDSKRLGVSPFERLAAVKDSLPCLYDFDLMLGGGHIAGYLIDAATAEDIANLFDTDKNPDPFLIAVGDGNHSLAAAKAHAEMGGVLAQKALVELTDIHDDSLEFEPIYRILRGTTPEEILEAVSNIVSQDSSSCHDIRMISRQMETPLPLKKNASLPVTDLQRFLDAFLAQHPSIAIDYIHGEETLRHMAEAPDAVGFLFEGMRKEDLFPAVAADGALVRKTFSMGEAADKRYYLEARKIKD